MDVGNMISGIVGWLGDNPMALTLLIGIAIGFFLGKR